MDTGIRSGLPIQTDSVPRLPIPDGHRYQAYQYRLTQYHAYQYQMDAVPRLPIPVKLSTTPTNTDWLSTTPTNTRWTQVSGLLIQTDSVLRLPIPDRHRYQAYQYRLTQYHAYQYQMDTGIMPTSTRWTQVPGLSLSTSCEQRLIQFSNFLLPPRKTLLEVRNNYLIKYNHSHACWSWGWGRGEEIIPVLLSLQHTHTHTHTHTHKHTHLHMSLTHTNSLSLSLSLTHPRYVYH